MQYKVPQFIEVEDKIFGPFTLKQFSYLAGGFGLSIIVWRTFAGTWYMYLILCPVIAFSLALTFLKPNGKPFIFLVQNFLFYILRPKKLFWRTPSVSDSKENVAKAKKESDAVARKEYKVPHKLFSSEQISNLAKSLDNK